MQRRLTGAEVGVHRSVPVGWLEVLLLGCQDETQMAAVAVVAQVLWDCVVRKQTLKGAFEVSAMSFTCGTIVVL